ncbi:hypothetical protein HDV00_003252 [Rhizophlyctis rosea]|nr:hypothetical protein HDV00_003252 [Rhizophlyctis rosea]
MSCSQSVTATSSSTTVSCSLLGSIGLGKYRLHITRPPSLFFPIAQKQISPKPNLTKHIINLLLKPTGLLLPQIPSPLSIHAQIQRHNTSRAEILARTYHAVMTSFITGLSAWEKGDLYTIASPNVFDVCLDAEEKDAVARAVRIGFEAKGWNVEKVVYTDGFGSLKLEVTLRAPVGMQRAVDVFLWKAAHGSHGCECRK